MTRMRLRDVGRAAAAPVAGAAAALTAGAAILCVWALSDPGGAGARQVPLAPAEELSAHRLLERPGARPADIAAARASALSALAQGPARATAWLDLAYADTLRSGRLTDTGRDALRRSWVFEPLGPDNSEWRVRFALEHWSELTPELRDNTLAEVRAQWRTNMKAAMVRALDSVQNPASRLAAALLKAELTRRPTGN